MKIGIYGGSYNPIHKGHTELARLLVEQGLVDEVRRLLDEGVQPGMTSMQGLGYKEIIPYLEGKCSLEEAVYILKRDTRHFAKRQLTWFRAEKDVRWIEGTEMEKYYG